MGRWRPIAAAYASRGSVVKALPCAYERRAACSAMTSAIDVRPWPTLTTIAPPAASRYSRPRESRIVESWASTATGGSATDERRKTRPVVTARW